MTASLRALLAGVIDYAGLFPPAQLPLDEAIRNYARYRTEPESWMLGRFVCPAGRLAELEAYRDLFGENPPFGFAVLGQGSGSSRDFNLVRAWAGCVGFEEKLEGLVRADVLEVRIPYIEDMQAFMRVSSVLLEKSAPTVFLEASPEYDWHRATIIRGIQESSNWAGFKLRCGGAEPTAFPSSEQVAFTITACRDARVRLKFTAGLHHPVRHFNAGMQTHMHGFLNVFGAGVLAHVRRLTEEQVLQIVEDEDPGHFVFDDEGFRWKDWRATVNEISWARQLITSFGSCSFDEPREDLRALGLLP